VQRQCGCGGRFTHATSSCAQVDALGSQNLAQITTHGGVYSLLVGMKRNLHVDLGTQEFELLLSSPGENRWLCDGESSEREIRHLSGGSYLLLHDQRCTVVDVEERDGKWRVTVDGHAFAMTVIDAQRARLFRFANRDATSRPVDCRVIAPLAGRVVQVLVESGDSVKTNQPLIVVEAMKMENEICALRDGSVKAVHVEDGQVVATNDTLITLHPPPPSDQS